MMDPPQRRLSDEDRTYAIVFINVLLALIVIVVRFFHPQSGVTAGVYMTFAVLTFFTVVAYMGNLTSVYVRALRAFMAYEAPEGREVFFPVWVFAVVNSIPIGYLIHMSGGILGSPYAQIPPALMIIGQLFRDIPPVTSEGPIARVLIRGAFRAYWGFLLGGVAFYAGLLIFQHIDGRYIGQPRAGLVVGLTAVLFVAGTFTNYLARGVRRPPTVTEVGEV
jgi:hypothetical protein